MFTNFLGSKEILDRLARTSRVRWYRPVLRSDSIYGTKRTLDLEMVKREHGQSKMMWRR